MQGLRVKIALPRFQNNCQTMHSLLEFYNMKINQATFCLILINFQQQVTTFTEKAKKNVKIEKCFYMSFHAQH